MIRVSALRHAELVSASIVQSEAMVRGEEWTLKQVQSDGCALEMGK
jgi:hypothetical protein